MTITKVYYFNDEKSPVTVKARKPGGEPWDFNYLILNQCEGMMFDIPVREGQAVWIKKWSGVVMIDACDAAALGDAS